MNAARKLILAPLALAPLLFIAAAAQGAASDHVDVIPLDAAINPVTANYVSHALQQAQSDGATAAVIEMDTPGGLDSSMRQIIRDMSAAGVPVVVWVGPAGARAGSAGVYITMASDVAAMAPNTNIGAAHPVGLPGATNPSPSPSASPATGAQQSQSDADVESQKVLNDSVAYIRSLAENHGRNADWAEDSVRNSVSITDRQAVDMHVVDLSASSLDDLLAKLDGRQVTRSDGRTFTLHTAGATVNRLPLSPFEQLLSVLADPTISYVLMLVGIYGMIFELSSPGAILPGVLGGLALIMGLLSLGTLPVNYAGLALIGFSLVLFVADVKVPTHGILTAGGIISFLLGSLALFNTGQSGLSISVPVIILVTAATGLFFGTIVRLGIRARMARPTTGLYELVGKVGEARSDLKPEGRVWVNGEWWKAKAEQPVKAGTRVEVVGVQGLTLVVKKAA